ncbi:MAG: hypothetical protein IKP86_10580 [Anaerolineaceae bacterium]|nr:hypothetical protein [Anaerolineaceae bacterium]
MVTVTFENGEFKFHGTFDCGYAGLYRDDRIRFPDETPESIRENGLQDKDLSNCDDDAITAEVAAFINAIEAKIQQNIQQFNDTFLEYLFDDFEGCGYPFWEYPEMVNQEFIQAHPDFDLEKSYDSGVKFSDPVFIPENAGHLEIEKRTRYPMFNLDHYLSTLTLHRINVYDDGSFSFIISDQMNYLCQLYGVVTPEFKFIDWNNG